MKILLVMLTMSALLAGCERDAGVQRQGSANEGKAAQSAGGSSANEGKAIGSAGR
jgi:hypothetical protein